MITIQQIHTTDKEYYCFAEELFVTAFPKKERREIALQREYTDCNEKFYNNILLADNEPVGFISYWNFDHFYYVEHFAIHETKRNRRYGQQVLSELKEKLQGTIVLEVELPDNEISKRRINFYQRQGFQLWENKYRQPPYRKGDNYLSMKLMVLGKSENNTDFEQIKKTLYKEVYQVEL